MSAKFNRRWLALPLALLLSAQAGAAVIEVAKSPYCGCCAQWVTYLREHGFDVKVTDREDMTSVKDALKVPADLRSCHTAKVGKYVVEGHVPAEDIQRLLKEQPKAIGIAVAGMPAGSPGMHVHGGEAEAYQTMLFTADGTKVFARH
jgi:hypothetical protein